MIDSFGNHPFDSMIDSFGNNPFDSMIDSFGNNPFDCKVVYRDGRPPEDWKLDLENYAPRIGDTLTIHSHGRQFYVSATERQLTPHSDETFMILHELRHCFECGIPYGNIHPDDECKTGAVQAVMES